MLIEGRFQHPVDKRDMRRLVKWAMAFHGVRYPELARRLQEIEVDITPKQLAERVNRGAFNAVFLVQIFMALGCDQIWIERLKV